MQIIVADYVITDVQEAGEYEFRLYNATAFTPTSGVRIPADQKGGRFCYRRAACNYNPIAKTLTVNALTIDTTTDALDNQRAKYALAGIYKGNRLVETILTDFSVPHDIGNITTWTILSINKNAKRIFLDDGYYNKNQINAIFAELANLIAGASSGVMFRSVYDRNNNGIVDDAEGLSGKPGAFYLDRQNHTGTQLSTTISDFEERVIAIGTAQGWGTGQPMTVGNVKFGAQFVKFGAFGVNFAVPSTSILLKDGAAYLTDQGKQLIQTSN